MITILALRNPEPEYAATRHNIGADIVRAFAVAHAFPAFTRDALMQAEMSSGVVGGHEVRLLLPVTYMNESGKVVHAAKLSPENTLVVHDELAVPLGEIKISYDSGAAGHNGAASVTNAFGTSAYTRVRVGIMPEHTVAGEARANFVLKRFTPDELARKEHSVSQAVKALAMIITKGRDAAMLEYHTRP